MFSPSTPKTFDLVKIRPKSLKIRTKSVEILAKCVKTFAKSLYVLWIYKKWHPKSKCRRFLLRSRFHLMLFGQVRGNLGKFRRNLGKNVSFFGGHFLWSFFRTNLGKFGQKILRTFKNLPAPTPMVKDIARNDGNNIKLVKRPNPPKCDKKKNPLVEAAG